MNRILAFLALVGLISAAAVHLASIAGIDVAEQAPFVWLLHIGMFVVFVPFVLSSRKASGAKPSLAGDLLDFFEPLIPGRRLGWDERDCAA